MAKFDVTTHVRRLRTVSEEVAQCARKLEDADPTWADLAALVKRLETAAKVANAQIEEWAHASHRNN